MKKLFSKKTISLDAIILMFSAGIFGATLIIGLILLYGLDKIF